MVWKTVLFMILIGLAEFSLSWLNHRINVFVQARRWIKATRLDLLANIISEGMPYFIYVIDPNLIYLVPKVIMNTLGTAVAASRKMECPVCGEIVGTEIDYHGACVFYNLNTGLIHICKKEPKPRKPRVKKLPGDITSA